jgi:predicted PurR-regulated permease PerM
VVVLVVMVPAVLIATLAVTETSSLFADLDGRAFGRRVSRLRKSLHLELPYAAHVRYIDAALPGLSQRESASADAAPHATVDDVLTAVRELEEEVRQGGDADKIPHLEDAIRALIVAKNSTPGSLPFGRSMAEAAGSYRRFTWALAGGGWRFRLMSLANPSDEEVLQWGAKLMPALAGQLGSWGSATGTFVFSLGFGLVIMIVAVYFFFADGPAMLRTVMRLSPLNDEYERELLDEFSRVSRAVVMATLLAAVTQGLLAGLGYWIAGAKLVFLLTVLTAVLALVPFVGAMSVWLPVSLWIMFVEERYLDGSLLAIWGMVAVSSADNLVKPMVLHGQSNLHPLLALLSVLGGVQALGPVGLLVGPMVVVFLQTSLGILHREVASGELRRPAVEPRSPLPLILSLRLRGLRLIYAPPRKVIARSFKERWE